MFFVIVKIVLPDTRAGWSDVKYKLLKMKMYQFKHDIPKANMQISEWVNEIFISEETY